MTRSLPTFQVGEKRAYARLIVSDMFFSFPLNSTKSLGISNQTCGWPETRPQNYTPRDVTSKNGSLPPGSFERLRDVLVQTAHGYNSVLVGSTS